jgi:hypothetical protein
MAGTPEGEYDAQDLRFHNCRNACRRCPGQSGSLRDAVALWILGKRSASPLALAGQLGPRRSLGASPLALGLPLAVAEDRANCTRDGRRIGGRFRIADTTATIPAVARVQAGSGHSQSSRFPPSPRAPAQVRASGRVGISSQFRMPIARVGAPRGLGEACDKSCCVKPEGRRIARRNRALPRPLNVHDRRQG